MHARNEPLGRSTLSRNLLSSTTAPLAHIKSGGGAASCTLRTRFGRVELSGMAWRGVWEEGEASAREVGEKERERRI